MLVNVTYKRYNIYIVLSVEINKKVGKGMSEMNERSISLPVIDEKTHFIIDYEEVTEDEARLLAAFKLSTEETQDSIKKILNIA